MVRIAVLIKILANSLLLVSSGKLDTTGLSVFDPSLRLLVQTVEIFHGSGILEDFGNLGSGGNKLEDIPVIFYRPGLVLCSMAHLQGVFQNGNKLFDLAIIENPGRNPALGGQSFQKVNPFGPFPVSWYPHLSFIRLNWDWKPVFADKIKRTLGEAIINLIQNAVLL